MVGGGGGERGEFGFLNFRVGCWGLVYGKYFYVFVLVTEVLVFRVGGYYVHYKYFWSFFFRVLDVT